MSKMAIFGIVCALGLAACSPDSRDGATRANAEAQPGIQTASVTGLYLVNDGTQDVGLGNELIALTNTNDEWQTYSTTTNPDGSFEVVYVPLGTYILTATGYAPSLVQWAQPTDDGNWMVTVAPSYILGAGSGWPFVQVGHVYF